MALSFPRYPPTVAPSGLRSTGHGWYVKPMRRESLASEQAFGTELMAQAGALYNFARHLTRDPALAEDLVQDAFARALDAQAQFVAGTNVKAWLFRILQNAFLDSRRRARRSPVEFRETDSDANDISSEVWLRGDIEIDRLRALVASDIDAALGRLSDDARTVVLLDLEGFTETEIAKIMGCAVGTVKSRLARARAVLREALQEYAK